MAVFTDIELEWDGRIYTIRPHKVMGAIARIEDVITLGELQVYGQRGAAPLAKLCTAYAAVLRYAGADVDADVIYAKMFQGGDAQAAIMHAILNLMQMMLPAAARAEFSAEADPPQDAPPGNGRATGAASSKKPTRRRSR